MNKPLAQNRGFTFMEMVVVIVIIGIISAMAVNQFGTMTETSRIEDTKNEMDDLALAVIGNPALQNNGIRTDCGYVGDVGSMPPNLDALLSNPGGYATWNGPYIKNSFEQDIDDYKKDAWQVDYIYTGGTSITSTGSGGSIARNLAGSIDDLLYNSISGNVLDLNGTPPGTAFNDSVLIRLTFPDGGGNMTTLTRNPDPGGYFIFDSIPIGNQNIELIYIPDSDTLRQIASVLPSSSSYNHYNLAFNVWFAPRENINNDIMAYWKLDDAGGSLALDISGNNYHGSLMDIDTGSAWVAGRIGGALEFDGVDDCVLLGDSISAEDQLSVAVWVRPASIGIDRQIVADSDTGGPVRLACSQIRHYRPEYGRILLGFTPAVTGKFTGTESLITKITDLDQLQPARNNI
jgi:general secretion pathway protein G